MTDKNNELTIKFTGERKVFFTSKKPAPDNTVPTTTNAQILTPPPTTTPTVIPTVTTPKQQPQQSVQPQQPKPVSTTNPPPQQNRPIPRFTNSNISAANQPPMIQPPMVQQQPVQSPPQVPVAKRERLPDEQPLNFDIAKYKVVNPSVKFEYRKTLIECKLGNPYREEGEVLTVFIGPDYKDSKEINRLAELCDYDIVKCITDVKPKNGKVIPLTSKSFSQFEGLFFVYLEDKANKLDYVDALRALFQQVDESEIEQICLPLLKSKLFPGTPEELANIVIDETTSFLSNRSRENRPTQISWVQLVTDEPAVFAELTKVYCEAVEKVSANNNLVINRGYKE